MSKFRSVVDTFELDHETAAKVNAKVYKTIVEHGISPETFRTLLRSFTGKELAYAFFRFGMIYTVVSEHVIGHNEIYADVRTILELAEQLSENELVNYFVKRFKRADEILHKLNESFDPQFI